MFKYIVSQFFLFLMDILETVAFVGSIYLIIHFYVFTPHRIQGQSMYPTFNDGENIITSKIHYKVFNIRRGDVVVFTRMDKPEHDMLIKRVIGLPGDEILIEDGEVYLNGKKLIEPYIDSYTNIDGSGAVIEGVPYKVPANSVFVMGDNRLNSQDSRVFGAININTIEGKVVFRYFPLDKIGVVKNDFPQDLQTYIYSNRLQLFTC
ncbi:MAG: signal peptidase I [Patescibacteria group bacterium]|nr:MAG: signal peptidase I [Patescibacteria group bacterium]